MATDNIARAMAARALSGGSGSSGSSQDIETIKQDVSKLNEDLGDIESKFEIETEAFSNQCSIIRNNTPNNFVGSQITGLKQYFDFGKNATLTKIKMTIKASNDDTAVLKIATLDDNIIATAEKAVTTEYTDVVFDLENTVIKEPVSVFVYTKRNNLLSYGSYGTPYEHSSFSYIFPDGTRKIAFKVGTSEKNPTNSNNMQCLVLFFDYTSKITKSIPDSIAQNIDATLLKSGKSADAKAVGDKLRKLHEDINFNGVHTIFVSTGGSDETGDGTEENPYATIYKANETITDSSETNKYEIIVKQGTYTDLQEKYSGVNGNSYQGVVCKPYVTYRSENILKPDLCVLKWDGADGYTKPVTDANCVNKCLFHIPTNSKGIYIKGFTFESKNTRYCMHVETAGSSDKCDWHFENCVFSWGGRPDTTEDGTVATACIGTGYSMLEFGEFVNCIIKCTNTNHANHMVFQSHDNLDNNFTSVKRGEHLRFENCYFSVADGSDYAHIDLRTTKTSPIISSFAEFINCSGIKLYVPSENYKKNFVCTEQHTIN
nr:MAG TPA: asparaginyl-tRNA synthetase [Caudoviricetes sp.]